MENRPIKRRISKERAKFLFPTLNGVSFVIEEDGSVVSFGVLGGAVLYILTKPMDPAELAGG